MAAKIRKQPSHYPFLPFHTIRSAQFLSSFIVSAFMSFFCWHLRHDHYKIPWTFLVVSCFHHPPLLVKPIISIAPTNPT